MDELRVTAGGLLLAVGGVAVAVLLAVMGVSVWQHFEGGLISQHVQNVRHSIGYVDAQNAHCRQDISDYADARAAFARDAADSQAQAGDQAHMLALVSDCRATVGQLSSGEVAGDVAQFLAAHQEVGP